MESRFLICPGTFSISPPLLVFATLFHVAADSFFRPLLFVASKMSFYIFRTHSNIPNKGKCFFLSQSTVCASFLNAFNSQLAKPGSLGRNPALVCICLCLSRGFAKGIRMRSGFSAYLPCRHSYDSVRWLTGRFTQFEFAFALAAWHLCEFTALSVVPDRLLFKSTTYRTKERLSDDDDGQRGRKHKVVLFNVPLCTV